MKNNCFIKTSCANNVDDDLFTLLLTCPAVNFVCVLINFLLFVIPIKQRRAIT